MSDTTNSIYKNRPSVKKSHKFALGFGDLGYSLVSCTVATYIMSYGTMAVGVSGTLMGIAIAIGTFFDAISDPIIGYLSDNSKNKFFGKRHGFILIGMIFLILTSIFIWSVPTNVSMTVQFVWFAVFLTLLRTCNTLYFTPICAFSVEISDDYNERTNIQGIRSMFYVIGMILPIIVMGFFQNKYTVYDDAGNVLIKGQFFTQGYIDFAYVGASLAIITTAIVFICTYSDIPRIIAKQSNEKVQEKKGLKFVLKSFFSVLKNKDMRYIIGGYSTAMIAATLIITLGFHVFTFTFTITTLQMYIVMGGLLFLTIAGQPLWMKISKKTNKKTTMILGLCTSLTGVILLFIAFLFRKPLNLLIARNSITIIILMLPLMIAGLGTGVLYSMPLALIGDVVVKNSRNDKNEKTGTYSGMMTFAYKTSQALTQFSAGVILDIIGFQEGSQIQPDSVASLLGWFLCIGLVLALVGGIFIFLRLKIDKTEITKIMEEKSNA